MGDTTTPDTADDAGDIGNQIAPGNASQFTGAGSLYNAINYMIQQSHAARNTAQLLSVSFVEGGGVDKPPTVKGPIMTHQIDGFGNNVEWPVIFGLPAFRLQGGTNAIIIDPQVGDTGLIVACDSDITNVKNGGAAAGVGSFRQNNWADSCFMGGMLNATPVAYIYFTTEGVINVVTPKDINVTNQGNITVNTQGNLSATVAGNSTVNTTGTTSLTSGGALTINAPNCVLDSGGHLSVTGDVTAGNGGPAVSLLEHEHSLVTSGTEISGPPVPT